MDTTKHVAGRPRSHDVDASILKAAVELLANKGPEAVTINAVARRSSVARASIYLRYPGREALLAATLRAAVGRQPIPVSGDLTTDFQRAAAQMQAILATPSFRAILPELVRGLLRQAEGTNAISFDVVAPSRRAFVDEYRRLAASSGLRTDVDPNLVIATIVGSMMMQLLATGTPPTPEMADQTAEIVLAGLRAPADQPA